MDGAWISSLGAGKKTCLGHHIATLKLHKLSPVGAGRAMASVWHNPEQKWPVTTSSVVTLAGHEMNVLLSRRPTRHPLKLEPRMTDSHVSSSWVVTTFRSMTTIQTAPVVVGGPKTILIRRWFLVYSHHPRRQAFLQSILATTAQNKNADRRIKEGKS